MNDAGLVSLCETVRDLDGNGDGILNRERLALEARSQRLAVVERHRDERLAVGRGPDLVNRADVGMIERCRCACLEQESLARFGMCGQMRWEKLQRDVSTEPLISRTMHE